MDTADLQPAPTPTPAPAPVTIVDIDIPMGSLFRFMIRWAIASIPALLVVGGVLAIVASIATVAVTILFGVLGGVAGLPR